MLRDKKVVGVFVRFVRRFNNSFQFILPFSNIDTLQNVPLKAGTFKVL
jgi:hypothetical protein